MSKKDFVFLSLQLLQLYTVQKFTIAENKCFNTTVKPLYRGHFWDPAGCSVLKGGQRFTIQR